MSKTKYSPEALNDLREIQKLLIENWGDEVASKIIKRLFTQVNRLVMFPLSGVNLGKLIDVSTDYRYIFTEKNYIFYHVHDGEIRIVRILNERQNYLQHLFELDSESN